MANSLALNDPAPARRLTEAFVVAALAAVSIVLLPASEAVGAGLGPKLLLLARMLALVLIASWLMRRAGERWRDFGLRRPKAWRAVAGVLIGYVAVALGVGAVRLVVLPGLGLQAPDVGAFAALEGDLAEYLFWALPVAWGSAAVGEELLFRGFVLGRLAQAGGGSAAAVHVAILAQAALFGALHLYQGAGGALVTGVVGLVMGYVWLFSGRNLWAPIILHGTIDLISMTAAYQGMVGG